MYLSSFRLTIVIFTVKSENIHLPCKGRYHCSANLLLRYLYGFKVNLLIISIIANHLNSNCLLMFNCQDIYSFGCIQTSQTGGQLYSNTSPYAVSDYSLVKCKKKIFVTNSRVTCDTRMGDDKSLLVKNDLKNWCKWQKTFFQVETKNNFLPQSNKAKQITWGR